jgi:hypothetical protein
MSSSWFATQGNHQAEMRHSFTARDQHGRPWMVVLEKKPMSPCYVTANFTVPDSRLVPPTHVLTFPADLPSTITIDYERWLTETTEMWRERRKRRIEVERKLYGQRANPDSEASEEVLDIVGPEPLDPELVRRCMNGDRELLGLAPEATKPARTATATPKQVATARRVRNRPTTNVALADAPEPPDPELEG